MTNTSKIIVAIIIIVIIALGIWYVASRNSAASSAPISQSAETGEATPGESGLTTNSSDSSNAALTQDMTSINGQMQGLSSDSATADQSMQAGN